MTSVHLSSKIIHYIVPSEIIIDRTGWETDSKDGPIPVGIRQTLTSNSTRSDFTNEKTEVKRVK